MITSFWNRPNPMRKRTKRSEQKRERQLKINRKMKPI
jgi:hypothetical protein